MFFNFFDERIKNNCNNKTPKFHNVQKFIMDYYSPKNENGLLLYHSTGSGKTISGLLLVKKFQKEGYNVIWVTRSSLKEDLRKVWEMVKPEPFFVLSYKQFSNVCLKKGLLYQSILDKQTDKTDLFSKTLIIIDEAHKLYNTTKISSQLKQQELHNIKVIEEAIFNCYDNHPEFNTKVVLLTATPVITYYDSIKMINLLITNKEKRFVSDKNIIAKILFDKKGHIKKTGRTKFLQNTKGIISFLDYTKDRTRFANVKVENVFVPLSGSERNKFDCDRLKNACNLFDINNEECKKAIQNCQKDQGIFNPRGILTQTKALKTKCELYL